MGALPPSPACHSSPAKGWGILAFSRKWEFARQAMPALLPKTQGYPENASFRQAEE